MTRTSPINADGVSNAGNVPPARDWPITSEDEREFHLAMELYKKQSGRMFPTWSEIFEVLRSLGYDKRIWRPVALPPAASSSPPRPLPAPHFGQSPLDEPMLIWFGQVETASFP